MRAHWNSGSLPRPFQCRLLRRNSSAESNLCFAVQRNCALKSTAVPEKKPRKSKAAEKLASKRVNSSVRRVSQSRLAVHCHRPSQRSCPDADNDNTLCTYGPPSILISVCLFFSLRQRFWSFPYRPPSPPPGCSFLTASSSLSGRYGSCLFGCTLSDPLARHICCHLLPTTRHRFGQTNLVIVPYFHWHPTRPLWIITDNPTPQFATSYSLWLRHHSPAGLSRGGARQSTAKTAVPGSSKFVFRTTRAFYADIICVKLDYYLLF